MPRSKNESTPVALQRALSGCFRKIDAIKKKTLDYLRREHVATKLGAIGLVRLTPLSLDQVHRLRQAALDLFAEASRLNLNLAAAIAPIPASMASNPAVQSLTPVRPRGETVLSRGDLCNQYNPYAWSGAKFVTRPPLQPLLTCPVCNAVALAYDVSEPMDEQSLTLEAQKLGTHLVDVQDRLRRPELRQRLHEIDLSKLTASELESARQSVNNLAALIHGVGRLCLTLEDLLIDTERTLASSLLPTCVLGLMGLLPFPGQEPCPHLVQIQVHWVRKVKGLKLDGADTWVRPGVPAEGYTEEQVVRHEFRIGSYEESKKPTYFSALCRAWFLPR